MKIAVTGGTGFLGRYLLRQLGGQHHRLRCWYRPSSDRSGLEGVDAVEWVEGELNDSGATDRLVRGVDAVVHSALQWQGEAGFRSAGEDNLLPFVETNFIGSLRLMEAARKAGVARFVFISTCAVHEVILDDRPLDETHPVWPTSFYGAHKAALEKFVHSYGLGQGWAICALRPTGVYAMAHPAPQSRWFDLVGQVVHGQPIATARGGKEVHAADVARAAALLLNADERSVAGQAFNCCDRYVAEQEVARIAKELTGSASSIANLNKGPKHQINTDKLRGLGMKFGGETLLRQTVQQLVEAQRG